MSKKHLFLLLIFAFLSFTQISYAQDSLLSTEEQISDASAAVSTEEPPVAESSASSLSKVPVANKTVAVSIEEQISNASVAVSTEEPPATEPTASSLSKVLVANKTVAVSTEEQISNDKCELNVAKSSANSITQVQNQTSENEISKSVKSQESFVGKNIFSFELAYLRNALKNNGWGIGLSFEQSLFQFFSIKGRFSHVTMFPKDLDFNITTVGIGAEVLFYPFRNGLDKLYFGFGNETDFYMYLSNSPENSKDTIITIYPKIGWKQNFFNLIFLDLFVSYNIFLSEVPTLSSNINLLERGINYGAKFKFNLSEIWTFVKNRFSS